MPVRLAVVGKGGAGKSVLAGTLARLLARRGERVLALDSDPMPGLTFSLGAEAPDAPPLLDAAERPEGGRWRLKKGTGPVRAIERYSTQAPDGVRLLQSGKMPAEGLAAIQGASTAFYTVVQRLNQPKTLREWSIVGDLSAGPRQSAYRWADYADTFLLVSDPSWKSALTARRIARIVHGRRGIRVLLVANNVSRAGDAEEIARRVGNPLFASVPRDQAVTDAERLGVPLLDHAPDSPAAKAMAQLAERLL